MAVHFGGRGPAHTVRARLLASVALPVVGDPLAVAVRDTTALSSAVDGSGWVADLTFKGMATGGVLDMAGLKALSLNVTRSGFNSAGAATTFTETIQAAAALRGVAPAYATQQNRVSGADVIASAVLRRRLYQGADTINSASVGAGAYTASSVASAAKAVGSIANNSQYAVPDPVYGFLVPHHQVRAADFRFEIAVAHAEARFGQQVACVEFRVRDVATSTDQGISVKCGTPELSTLQAFGPKVECYGGTIPVGSLTQGVKYEVYARIYPWVAASYFDTTVMGVAYGIRVHVGNATGVRFMCDKAGTYGDQRAYVKVGAGGGGVVNNPALPFPSIALAAKALAIANNAKTGNDKRNNVGGSTIYLMEASTGAGADHAGFGGSFGSEYSDFQTGTEAWTTITVDPAATGVVRFVTSDTKFSAGITRFLLGTLFKIDRVAFAGTSIDDIVIDNGLNGAALWIDGGPAGTTLTWSNASPDYCFVRRTDGLLYVTNIDGSVGTWVSERANLFMGNVVRRNYGNWPTILFFGNRCLGGFALTDPPVGTTRWMVGWNEFTKNTNGLLLRWGATTNGFALISNSVECMVNGDPSCIMFADSGAADATNVLSFHNTLSGGRCNGMYVASGIAPSGILKAGDEAYNIAPYWNVKGDVFRSGAEAGSDMNTRTGNWAWTMGVNRRGIIVQFGDNTNATNYGPLTWLGEVQPPKSRPTATVTFVDNKSGFGTGGGGGNYRLTGDSITNHAIGVVDQLWGMLRFDLDGRLRFQDGTGAAGAYERL